MAENDTKRTGDQFTTSNMFNGGNTDPADNTNSTDDTNPEPTPAPEGDGAEDTPRDVSDEAQGRTTPDDDEASESFVERMAQGQLTRTDDEDRVLGRLGGTDNERELARMRYQETGGIRPDEPVTNPLGAADTANADEHPSTRQRRIELEREKRLNDEL